jgi:hypothetical protein
VNVAWTQLDVLERERDGGPLALQIQVHGHVLSDVEPDLSSPATFWSDLGYDIKAADWVEVLEQWRYAQGFLVQVPGYGGYESTTMRNASRELGAAANAIVEGRYRDAVAVCRDALETAYTSTDGSLYPELAYKVENLRQADKDARFWLIRRALWALTHAAKHNDDVSRSIEWHRRDAVAAVSILSALIQQHPPE